MSKLSSLGGFTLDQQLTCTKAKLRLRADGEVYGWHFSRKKWK